MVEQVTQCTEDICDGSGEIERVEYECNDSTGYNSVVMGTGEMEPCPCTLE